MKNTIVFGSFLAVFILLTMPIGSSIQYQQTKQITNTKIDELIKLSEDTEEFVFKTDKMDYKYSSTWELIVLLTNSLIKNIQNHLIKNEETINLNICKGILSILTHIIEDNTQVSLVKIYESLEKTFDEILCFLLQLVAQFFLNLSVIFWFLAYASGILGILFFLIPCFVFSWISRGFVLLATLIGCDWVDNFPYIGLCFSDSLLKDYQKIIAEGVYIITK